MFPTLDNVLTSALGSLPRPKRVYVAGCSGEPLGFADALKEEPSLAAGTTFVGVWIPGINKTDWSSFHPTAEAETIFLSAALRPSFETKQTRFLPLSYVQAWNWLSSTPLDAAIVLVSPPDGNGQTSCGLSVDFSHAIIDRKDLLKIAVVTPSMLMPINARRIPLDSFDIVCQSNAPLVELDTAALGSTFEDLGKNVATLIDDGDTIQLGLGNLQQAVLEQLGSHASLRLHAGMISSPMLPLLDDGVFAPFEGSVTTGVAIGSRQLYDRVAADSRIRFRDVGHTHAITTLAGIKKLKAINSVLEVDLFGQANAEYLNGRQASGIGGLVDFLRGAAASEGGRGIVGLPSTAKRGKISRIVPRLSGNAVSIARTDVETVVTEYGIADLREKSIDQRAAALIDIADPAFRTELATAWEAMRSGM
ncbi:MAG: acetyl-CoA hydrolase/transferase C-terminal domain-containing protein [Pseudomonadota bacterium]